MLIQIDESSVTLTGFDSLARISPPPNPSLGDGRSWRQILRSALSWLFRRHPPLRQTVRQRREPSSNRESTTDNRFRRASKLYVHAAIQGVEICGTSQSGGSAERPIQQPRWGSQRDTDVFFHLLPICQPCPISCERPHSSHGTVDSLCVEGVVSRKVINSGGREAAGLTHQPP
jgi:hypothetical protein